MKRTKLANRVYKGIPDRWRMAAWWTFAEEQAQKWNGKGKGKSTAQELTSDYTVRRHSPSFPIPAGRATVLTVVFPGSRQSTIYV